jgi:hypothetical protein
LSWAILDLPYGKKARGLFFAKAHNNSAYTRLPFLEFAAGDWPLQIRKLCRPISSPQGLKPFDHIGVLRHG